MVAELGQEEEEEEGDEEIPCPTMLLRLSFTFVPDIAGQACVRVELLVDVVIPNLTDEGWTLFLPH